MPALIGGDTVADFEDRPFESRGKEILKLEHRLQLVPFYSWLLYGANTSVLFCLFSQRILNDFLPFSIFARGPDVTRPAGFELSLGAHVLGWSVAVAYTSVAV